jgi:hypothetical protein
MQLVQCYSAAYRPLYCIVSLNLDTYAVRQAVLSSVCICQCPVPSGFVLLLQSPTHLLRARSEWSNIYLTNWLTLLSRTLLERPPVVYPLDNFPALCGTQRFITPFSTALHLFLSLARLIQSTPPPSHLSRIHPNIIHPPMSWSS